MVVKKRRKRCSCCGELSDNLVNVKELGLICNYCNSDLTLDRLKSYLDNRGFYIISNSEFSKAIGSESSHITIKIEEHFTDSSEGSYMTKTYPFKNGTLSKLTDPDR